MAIKIPKGAIIGLVSNPSGKWHNGAETKWLPNPLDDPELIYRADLDSTHIHHSSDGIPIPEFMNNKDLAKSKDYVVYDKNITSSQADLVDAAIKYAWNASELANADRNLLSEWNVQSDLNTIVIGISNLKDLQGTNDFEQAITTKQPLLSGMGKTSLATFDGVDDFLSQPVTSANFRNLTYFEYWTMVDNYADNQPLMFSDSTSGNNYLRFRIVSNIVHIISNDFGSFSRVDSDSTLTASGKYIIGFICTGSEYKIIINGVETSLTIIAGSNTGKMIGSYINPSKVDVVSVSSGQGSVKVYYANKERYGLAIGGTSTAAATTAAEQIEIFNYINKRFSLGL